MSFAGECNYNGNGHTQPIYKMSVQMVYYSSTPIYADPFWSTSTRELVLNDNIKVFPNPSNGSFSLEMPEENFMNARAEVISLTGQTVLSQPFSGIQRNAWRFSLADQPNGVYLLRIATENGTYFRKLMKTE